MRATIRHKIMMLGATIACAATLCAPGTALADTTQGVYDLWHRGHAEGVASLSMTLRNSSSLQMTLDVPAAWVNPTQTTPDPDPGTGGGSTPTPTPDPTPTGHYEYRQVLVSPAWTETINHPEVSHVETVTVEDKTPVRYFYEKWRVDVCPICGCVTLFSDPSGQYGTGTWETWREALEAYCATYEIPMESNPDDYHYTYEIDSDSHRTGHKFYANYENYNSHFIYSNLNKYKDTLNKENANWWYDTTLAYHDPQYKNSATTTKQWIADQSWNKAFSRECYNADDYDTVNYWIDITSSIPDTVSSPTQQVEYEITTRQEQQKVIDQEAWTETIRHDAVYETQLVWVED